MQDVCVATGDRVFPPTVRCHARYSLPVTAMQETCVTTSDSVWPLTVKCHSRYTLPVTLMQDVCVITSDSVLPLKVRCHARHTYSDIHARQRVSRESCRMFWFTKNFEDSHTPYTQYVFWFTSNFARCTCVWLPVTIRKDLCNLWQDVCKRCKMCVTVCSCHAHYFIYSVLFSRSICLALQCSVM